jgi:hypothetical protein
MLFSPVYLYLNNIDVYTLLLDSWLPERYNKVYNRNLKIFRGVDNRIDIQVRNSDQKATNIVGSVVVFNLISRDCEDLILKKDCNSMDLTTGKVTVILTDAELLNLNNGQYNYSIVKEVRNAIDSATYTVSSKMPLYMDSQYGAVGVLDVTGDIYGTPNPSLVIDTFNYTNPFTQGDETLPWFESAIINARPEVNTGNALHTFQFYSTQYRGTVKIQASMDLQGGSPRENSWVELESFTTEGDRFYKNIVGKYNWFRIKHIPLYSTAFASFTIAQTTLFSYNVSINNPGKGYGVGNIFEYTGSTLGGETTSNNLTITVTEVDQDGAITGITWEGRSYNGVKTFVLDTEKNTAGTIDKILYR